jgi:hypothetical protein
MGRNSKPKLKGSCPMKNVLTIVGFNQEDANYLPAFTEYFGFIEAETPRIIEYHAETSAADCGVVVLTFSAAFPHAIAVTLELSEQYPDLNFALYTDVHIPGWGTLVRINKGRIIEVHEPINE